MQHAIVIAATTVAAEGAPDFPPGFDPNIPGSADRLAERNHGRRRTLSDVAGHVDYGVVSVAWAPALLYGLPPGASYPSSRRRFAPWVSFLWHQTILTRGMLSCHERPRIVCTILGQPRTSFY
jgi:hypothetical protein